MSPQLPCAVERDLARYAAEMSERDRYHDAVEKTAISVYEKYIKSPEDVDLQRLINAIERTMNLDLSDASVLAKAIAERDFQTIGETIYKLYDILSWRDAYSEAKRMLKERK